MYLFGDIIYLDLRPYNYRTNPNRFTAAEPSSKEPFSFDLQSNKTGREAEPVKPLEETPATSWLPKTPSDSNTNSSGWQNFFPASSHYSYMVRAFLIFSDNLFVFAPFTWLLKNESAEIRMI